MPDYLLDACAMIAFFNNEEGSEVVDGLLNKARRGEVSLNMSAVNFVEVYYDRIRATTLENADEKMEWMHSVPIKIIDANDPAIIRESACIKASGGMSLADAFLVATAKRTGATIVTADWGELEKVEEEGQIPFCWIRAKPREEMV